MGAVNPGLARNLAGVGATGRLQEPDAGCGSGEELEAQPRIRPSS